MRPFFLAIALLLAGCSEGAAEDSSRCATASADASNPPSCPAKYSHSLSGERCPADGLQCWYPGVGDMQSDGCYATALLACHREPTPDGGKAATATWRAAQ